MLQLVFATMAGAGALVALIDAYRRQKIAEADSVHDRTRVFNERFTTITAQLGDAQPAVPLAGVHAMAGLADDWKQNRQTCVDELRFPGYPHPSLLAAPQLGLYYLEPSDRQRYRELAVFAGRGAVPRPAVEALWARAGLSTTDARDPLARFGDLRRNPVTDREQVRWIADADVLAVAFNAAIAVAGDMAGQVHALQLIVPTAASV